MRTIRLYGSLAQEFGSEFRLDVRSISEACHALGVQLPGFRCAITEGRFRITLGKSPQRGWKLDESLITFGLPAGDLHIVPVVRGRGGRGASLGKILVGTVIAAATWWMGGPGWVIGIGASIALQGVSSLLTPKKKNEQQRRSYMFNGADNTINEGDCVPLIIGRCMVNPKTISAGVTTSDSNGLPTP